jgi:hypothetical protein
MQEAGRRLEAVAGLGSFVSAGLGKFPGLALERAVS